MGRLIWITPNLSRLTSKIIIATYLTKLDTETHLLSLGLTQKCYQHVMTSYLYGLAPSVRYTVDRQQTIFSDIASHLFFRITGLQSRPYLLIFW